MVTCSDNLGLEIKIHQLSLVRSPVAIRVSVVHQLAGARIPHLSSCVRERSLGAPFDSVASRLGNEERLAATCVAFGINTFLYSVIENFAFGNGGCWEGRC